MNIRSIDNDDVPMTQRPLTVDAKPVDPGAVGCGEVTHDEAIVFAPLDDAVMRGYGAVQQLQRVVGVAAYSYDRPELNRVVSRACAHDQPRHSKEVYTVRAARMHAREK